MWGCGRLMLRLWHNKFSNAFQLRTKRSCHTTANTCYIEDCVLQLADGPTNPSQLQYLSDLHVPSECRGGVTIYSVEFGLLVILIIFIITQDNSYEIGEPTKILKPLISIDKLNIIMNKFLDERNALELRFRNSCDLVQILIHFS